MLETHERMSYFFRFSVQPFASRIITLRNNIYDPYGRRRAASVGSPSMIILFDYHIILCICDNLGVVLRLQTVVHRGCCSAAECNECIQCIQIERVSSRAIYMLSHFPLPLLPPPDRYSLVIYLFIYFFIAITIDKKSELSARLLVATKRDKMCLRKMYLRIPVRDRVVVCITWPQST